MEKSSEEARALAVPPDSVKSSSGCETSPPPPPRNSNEFGDFEWFE